MNFGNFIVCINFFLMKIIVIMISSNSLKAWLVFSCLVFCLKVALLQTCFKDTALLTRGLLSAIASKSYRVWLIFIRIKSFTETSKVSHVLSKRLWRIWRRVVSKETASSWHSKCFHYETGSWCKSKSHSSFPPLLSLILPHSIEDDGSPK